MIHIEVMTREQCHDLYQGWENDPAIYMDMSRYKTYRYSADQVDKYYDTMQDPTRILFAVINDRNVIGELQLKNIDRDTRECTMSIHLQNDRAKGRGYGTQAELLAIQYAFQTLDLIAINADVVRKNERSQHVLEKVGFQLRNEDNEFSYYRIER